jgi:hypothetical protein
MTRDSPDCKSPVNRQVIVGHDAAIVAPIDCPHLSRDFADILRGVRDKESRSGTDLWNRKSVWMTARSRTLLHRLGCHSVKDEQDLANDVACPFHRRRPRRMRAHRRSAARPSTETRAHRTLLPVGRRSNWYRRRSRRPRRHHLPQLARNFCNLDRLGAEVAQPTYSEIFLGIRAKKIKLVEYLLVVNILENVLDLAVFEVPLASPLTWAVDCQVARG